MIDFFQACSLPDFDQTALTRKSPRVFRAGIILEETEKENM
jgi:hypothetical protein